MIHIVDYGLGNVQALLTMFKRLGLKATLSKNAEELIGANKIILPGVGAFDHAIKLLDQSGMRPVLETLVLKQKVPVLGICVGMQILATYSEEGLLPGLGWVPGKVRSFHSDERSANLPLPHMGWNDVKPKINTPIFAGLESDARFYFLHSYFFECDDPSHVAAVSSYGMDFGCSVSACNVYGVQFHPEKSHHFGSQLLKNFGEL
jgi:glutamine amidotransferase